MTHKLKTETFSQKTEHSGGVFLLPLTQLFSFVTFHLRLINCPLLSMEFSVQTAKVSVKWIPSNALQ